jgi:hypothetical protein
MIIQTSWIKNNLEVLNKIFIKYLRDIGDIFDFLIFS